MTSAARSLRNPSCSLRNPRKKRMKATSRARLKTPKLQSLLKQDVSGRSVSNVANVVDAVPHLRPVGVGGCDRGSSRVRYLSSASY